MRLNTALALAVVACVVSWSSARSARAEGPPPSPAASPSDPLGDIVVVAGAVRALPKIAVVPSLSAADEDVTLRSVVRRDLDLSGEFDVLGDGAAPDGVYLQDSAVDTRAWAAKGVEAVVKVTGKPRDPTHAEIRGQVFLVARGAAAVFDKRYLVSEAKLRQEAHRLADKLIGALTGQPGGFASHLAFASTSGGVRQVFTIDADGHDARTRSPSDVSSLAPAFGKDGAFFYASAPPGGVYQLHTASGAVVPLPFPGSVYGLAFSRDHAKVAVALGVGDTVQVFAGADFSSIAPASDVKMALHPTFTPSGELAFSGEGRFGQRIFVGGKPVTPEGIFASSPVFCKNPDGVRLVFAAGAGVNADLVSAGEHGGSLVRLTQAQGRNGYPACSPDGRLLAFFSTRTSGEGPGLYLMRLDGGRPRRIAPLLGDSLRWDALPPGDARELAD
jgi:TolB protein